jgi:hypothetical protein
MERIIKFRGKRIHDGQWVVGSLITWPDGDREICVLESDAPVNKFQVWPETIGQFLGLKDRKKIDIYEGDRVNDLVDECIVVWDVREAKFCLQIVHDDEAIGIRQTHKPMPLDAIRLIVIESIHDVNPASGQAGVNHMLHDPNAKQAEQEAAGAAQPAEAAAQESASQDQAMEAAKEEGE